MNPTITFSESGDASFIAAAIGDLQSAKVYVGIPEAQTSRPGEPVTNAGLMYIHTNGSEVMHIPPRPVIEPAIENANEIISKELSLSIESRLDGNKELSKQHLAKAGILGANASKRWFTDPRNNWAPNAPSTIAAKGSDRPLIDTGELRRAITSVTTDD